MSENAVHEFECYATRELTGDQYFCCCDQLRARQADCDADLAAARLDRNATLDDVLAAVERLHRGSCRWYYAERRCTCGMNDAIAALRKPEATR